MCCNEQFAARASPDDETSMKFLDQIASAARSLKVKLGVATKKVAFFLKTDDPRLSELISTLKMDICTLSQAPDITLLSG